jgi:hypothetical protein
MTTELTITSHDKITQQVAAYLIERMYEDAPQDKIMTAAIICQQYSLNPLIKNIYLIKYGNDWTIVLGIKATRQMAIASGHRYSFVDGPRMMKQIEAEDIYGVVDPAKWYAFVKIRDQFGNEYPGYGTIQKEYKAYGTDKGNSPQNLCFIRAERNAIDKMAPGALPDIETTDEQIVPITDYKAAIELGGKEFEVKVEQDKDDLFGSEPELTKDDLIKDIRLGFLNNNWTTANLVSAIGVKFPQHDFTKIKMVTDALNMLTLEQLKQVRELVNQK